MKGSVLTSELHVAQAVSKSLPPAFIDELDDYVEQLYEEDLSKKVTATGMIAQLFRDAGQIEVRADRENNSRVCRVCRITAGRQD